jgi:hypothetical protein
VLLTETKLLREQERLSTGGSSKWSWIFGDGAPIHRLHAPAKGGVAALVHCSVRGSIQKLYADRHQLWLSMTAASGKPTVIGVVYMPGATTLAARTMRRRIYTELEARIEEYSRLGTVVLGGDWNARISANGDAVTNAEGVDLCKFADEHGMTIVNTLADKTQGNFTRTELRCGGLQQSTVDYVLVRSADTERVQQLVIPQKADERVLSDHKPLVLSWLGAPPVVKQQQQPPARLRWKVEDITATEPSKLQYQTIIRNHMKQWTQEARKWLDSSQSLLLSAAESASVLLSTWEARLNDAAESAVGKKRVAAYAKSWVKGGPLLEMISTRNQLRQLCEAVPKQQQTSSDRSWVALSERARVAQRTVRKEIHRRKRAEQEEMYERVEKEWRQPKLFYRHAKHLRSAGATSTPVLKTKEGRLVTALHSRLEVAREHYAGLGRDERKEERGHEHIENEDTAPLDAFDGQFARAMEQRLELLIAENDRLSHQPRSKEPQPDSNELSRDFSEEEMLAALRLLQNGKAVGADAIHGEFLRYGGDAMCNALLLLFNRLWRTESWPAHWSLGLIVPIYKKNGAPEELENHRPITLLSIPSKLFEILLNTRLMQWVEANHALSDEQGGFRSKRSCADQIFILHEVWSDRRERGLPTFAAFLDVKSAYDRVWRTGLWCRLHDSGIRGKPWRMLREMYRVMRRAVLVDGERTIEFDVEVGVSQGSVLSPLLYSVFIDGLISYLKKDKRFGVTIAGQRLVGLLYADDIVLLAEDAATLQLMLTAVSQYARQWRFHFNPRKSHVVIQGSESQVAEARATHWHLGTNIIATVDEYKYLGMEMGRRRGAYTTFCQRLVAAAQSRMRDLHITGCRMDQLDPRCSARLWSTLVRPILEYGAETWRPTSTQALTIDRLQTRFARGVLGCSQSTANVFVNSELGLRSLSARRDACMLWYWRRLCAAAPERLLHRVFRRRVQDVSADAAQHKHSLCVAMECTLGRYGLADEFERVSTEQVYKEEEWHTLVSQHVMQQEQAQRLTEISEKSSLQQYQQGDLAPRLGKMASYLVCSRNQEGVWIRCRMRSGTLALLLPLGRLCDPAWTHVQCRCTICPRDDSEDADAAGEPEDTVHFASRCRAEPLVALRHGLIARLRRVARESPRVAEDLPTGDLTRSHTTDTQQQRELCAACAVLLSRLAAAEAEFLRPCSAAENVATTAASTAARNDWMNLILGGESYVCASGNVTPWPAPLMQLMHTAVHNFLMLSWRARARLMHGVARVRSDGSGLEYEPYAKFKGIGVRGGG